MGRARTKILFKWAELLYHCSITQNRDELFRSSTLAPLLIQVQVQQTETARTAGYRTAEEYLSQ